MSFRNIFISNVHVSELWNAVKYNNVDGVDVVYEPSDRTIMEDPRYTDVLVSELRFIQIN